MKSEFITNNTEQTEKLGEDLAKKLDTGGVNSAFIALFAFGIAQCWLYRKTNAIWSPMLNHALFNLTNLLLMFIVE